MSFKTRISNHETLYGIIVTLNNPCIGEILSECGFDWLWVDMEHAPFSLAEVQAIAQAVGERCASLVRIPINSEEWITRVLDLGVEGIIIPHVSSAAEARRIAELSYYPPLGCRSVSMSRASRYGMNSNYQKETNENRVVFLQIEDKEGVEDIEEIVKVAGVDGIIIGPYDLSGSYGKPGLVEDEEVVAAIEKVFHVCKEHNMPIGIFARNSLMAKKYVEKGFQLVAIGVDVHYFSAAAKAAVELLRS